MNSRENALKLRVQKLEIQNAALKLTYDRMLADIEMTESAGCAFAWDLASEVFSDFDAVAIYLIQKAHVKWLEAVEAGERYQGARQWVREQAKDRAWRETTVLALNNDRNLELETPYGRYVAAELMRT